jgi:uncharacterized protein (DUF1800 family)
MAAPTAQRKSSRASRGSLAAVLAALLLSSLALAAPYLAAAQNRTASALPATPLTQDQAILHALNRLGYGPRPGDLARVREMGLAKWIDQQLHPEAIDDSKEEARLRERFSTLSMSSTELLEKFPQPRVAARQQGMTPQELRQAQQAEQQRLRQAQRQGGQAPPEMGPAEGQAGDMTPPGQGPPGPGNPGGPPGPNLMNYRENQTPQRIVAELSMAKMDRAIYSERQLYEQMVDFWFNHFNVFAGKGQDRWLLTSYERDAIRQHAMGKFRDLLEATAQSPAMLFYLDNWQSTDPDAAARLQQGRGARQQGRGPFGRQRLPMPAPAQQQAQRPQRGLNENYGRELMELHTLGVDGGYTQTDVINVARAFTGWTIRTPQRDPEFFFDVRMHDPKEKIVLGQKINAGGMRDGEKVLDLLARHPKTAHHISLKLARHFVSDNPPTALVERMAQTFLKTDGDIRAVLRTMLDSPEFWSTESYRAKIKTPFELVVSAARAVGGDANVSATLVQWTGRIGQPLYQYQAPTGYPDTADSWVNTGALLNRLNFSLALAANRMPGVRVDTAALLGGAQTADARATLDKAIDVLLGGQVSPETRRTLETHLSDPQIVQASLDDPIRQINYGVVAGLVLGAPEFQRR